MKTKKRNFKETTKSLFLTYTVIPIFILVILFFIFTITIFKVILIHDTTQASSHIEEKMSSVNQQYRKEVNRIAALPDVTHYLKTLSHSNLVFEEFYHFNNQQQVKSIFNLFDGNGQLLLSSANTVNDASMENLTVILRQLQKDPKKLIIAAGKNQYSHGKVTVLSFAKAIIDDGRVIGFVIFQLNEEDLLNLVFAENADIAVITDPFDTIVVSTNSIVKGLINKFSPLYTSDSHVQIKDATFYISEKQTNDHFKIYTLKKTNISSIVVWIYFLFVSLIGFVFYFLVKHLAEKMSSKNVQSIETLLSAVSRLQTGDLKAYVKMDTGDEFEVLGDQYNVMLDNLNQLTQRNRELAEIRRVNEIKFLQSQFNPHFLFNVLETLRYTMLMDTNQAQNIILTLSKLLRYSLRNEAKDVLFKVDLDYIVDYLRLHKYRFGDRLQYEIDIPDEIKQIFVPKLLLQPIIENAIKYGYQGKTHLKVVIKGEVSEGDMILTVCDNGSGMEDAKLTQITALLQEPQGTPEQIGLYNTHRKIALLYGEGYGLTIRSVLGQGTEVIIKLPVDKGEGQDV
jgi:two-component system, sensor histidine kinase YesM